MTPETILQEILDQIKELKISVNEIEQDLHGQVRDDYVEKIKLIDQQQGKKFKSKEELLRHLKNGL